jgi:hypothetical protein
MPEEVDFPNWWQAEVIKARDYISKAQHYLEFEEKQPALDAMALEEEKSLDDIAKALFGLEYDQLSDTEKEEIQMLAHDEETDPHPYNMDLDYEDEDEMYEYSKTFEKDKRDFKRKELEAELGHETNDIGIFINNKLWKRLEVGYGYTEQDQRRRAARMKNSIEAGAKRKGWKVPKVEISLIGSL